MSTLRTTNLQHPSAASANVTLGSDGKTTVNGAMVGAGMDLINKTDFSAVSSVSLNNVFSSAYDNYRVVTDMTGSTTLDAQFRFRSGGADNSSASYSRQQITGLYVDSVIGSGATGSTVLYADYFSGASQRHGNAFDVYLPFAAAYTAVLGSKVMVPQSGIFGGIFNANTSFDGFSMIASTGTISGTIRVYGYRNS